MPPRARPAARRPRASRPPRRSHGATAAPSAVALGLCLALVTAPLRLAAAEPAPVATATAASSPPATARASGWTTGVSLLEEYRLRRASRALTEPGPLGEAAAVDDQLDHRLRLHADAQADGLDDRFRARFSGVLFWDLDGTPGGATADLFAAPYDGSRLWAAPYALSAEWHDVGILDHARVGRQDTEHGLPLTFDGASLGLRPLGRELLLFAFGGQTVHFFQTRPGFFESWVAAAGAALRPLPALELELDGRLLRERVDDPVGATGDLTTASYGLTTTTRTELVSARLAARGLDDRPSHLMGAMQLYVPSAGLGAIADLATQLVTLGEVAESENPYYALLGPSLPHVRYRFELFHELALGQQGATWTHLLGWRGRQVVGHEAAPFNRNFGAAYLMSRVDDLGLPGLFFGATVEYNYVPTSRDEPWLVALGGSAGYVGKALRAELGTDYERYKINYYQQVEELHGARTVFGALGYRVTGALELRGRYELEIVDRYLESFYVTARQDL